MPLNFTYKAITGFLLLSFFALASATTAHANCITDGLMKKGAAGRTDTANEPVSRVDHKDREVKLAEHFSTPAIQQALLNMNGMTDALGKFFPQAAPQMNGILSKISPMRNNLTQQGGQFYKNKGSDIFGSNSSGGGDSACKAPAGTDENDFRVFPTQTG